MKTPHAKILAAFLLGGALLPPRVEAAHQYEADKIPVLVMQSEVTVDGEERPALGRSFTDTLTGGLLKSGGFSVIDYLSNGPIAAEIAKGPAGRPPELSASQFGQMTGAHLVYVPRMIVEDDFVRMTIKKIRVTDGSVLAVYEAGAQDDRGSMFTLAGELLDQITEEVSRERAARSAAERRLRKAGETPIEELEPTETQLPAPEIEIPVAPEEADLVVDAPPTPEEKPEVEAASKTRPGPLPMARKPEKAARPEKPAPATEDVGRVTSVNEDYAFCILSVEPGAKVAVDDELRVLIDDPLVPLVKLRVSKVDGRQVVADRVSGATMDMVSPGQRAIRINKTEP